MKYKKIYLEITNNCNLNCDFCIKNKRVNKYIQKEDFNFILNKIKDYTDYLYFHVLGEPLMHPNINKLIDLAKDKGFYVNITTNGYLIDRIKDNTNIRQLNISLHSYSDKYHISLLDYLDKIFLVVDRMIVNKTYVSLRLWVNNSFNKDIIEYINKRYNINIEFDVQNYKINSFLFINNFHEFIWPDLNNNILEEQGSCYGLRDHIGILVDGTIIPCCLDTLGIINLGNIYQDNLEDVIHSSRYQNILEGFKNNKKCEQLCQHCKFI